MAGPKPIVVEGGNFVLTQQMAAILAGVTAQTLILWRKQENPPPEVKGGYPAKEFGAWLCLHRAHKASKSPTKNEPVSSLREAESRLKLAQAIKAERQNEIDAGELLVASDVESAWQNILSRVRSRMLGVPSKVAPLVVSKTDPFEIRTIIETHVRDALQEASDDWREIEGESDE